MRAPKRASRRPQRHLADDSGAAFLPDLVREGATVIGGRRSRTTYLDDEARALAEEFLASAVSADNAFEDARDEMVVEELGGPFVDDPVEWLRSSSRANASPWAA